MLSKNESTDKKRRCRRIMITVILIIVIFVLFYVSFFVMPLLTTLAMEEVKTEVINIVNYANDVMMQMPIYYKNYFEIYFDGENKIAGITANTGLINQVNTMLQQKIQNQLNLMRTKRVSLPIGAFTGSSILAHMGTLIPINIKTICNCSTRVKSKFEEAGINQVRHSLVLLINVEISVLLPVKTENQTVVNDFILTENIITGDVPETLLLGNEVTDYLDLVP